MKHFITLAAKGTEQPQPTQTSPLDIGYSFVWIKRLFVFWQVTDQVGQRFRLATRALSATVSAAIRCYLTRWEVRAQAIGVIDRWFEQKCTSYATYGGSFCCELMLRGKIYVVST